ncbi:MAG: hypothetical protein AAGI68_15710 [Planctomycetota bacterium]
MVVITSVAASTAIRIEWYNHAVGGFLPRPQPPSLEGNDVKWRAAGPKMMEWHYRIGLAQERGLELDSVKDREALFALSLSGVQRRELSEIKRSARLNTEFRSLVAGMGLLQHLLVPVALLIGVLILKGKPTRWRMVAWICIGINSVSGVLMLYREYFLSLGL